MEPTHGQWKWHWRSEDGIATGSVFAEPREGHAYAVAMCPRYQSKEQWEADATLIVAAKDMLAALKEVEDYCTRGGDLESMLEIVRAAIAKPEGR